MKIALAVTLLAALVVIHAQAPEAQTESVWSCPVHAIVNEQNPGKCPICRRDLVLVTATVTWTCADRPDINRPVRGKCADGSPMEARYTQSTHANHNPRHGGLFFMAPDLWHHLEGAYADDTLRVYFYDDYTKPLAPERRNAVVGRIVTKETFDTATRTTKEITTFPLKASADGDYLEARVGRMRLPAERLTTIGALVRRGAFNEVWVPAFQAKDLALALDVRTASLPSTQRPVAGGAIERLVRAAWAIDAAGDTGNRGDVEHAYNALADAARDVEQVFAR